MVVVFSLTCGFVRVGIGMACAGFDEHESGRVTGWFDGLKPSMNSRRGGGAGVLYLPPGSALFLFASCIISHLVLTSRPCRRIKIFLYVLVRDIEFGMDPGMVVEKKVK